MQGGAEKRATHYVAEEEYGAANTEAGGGIICLRAELQPKHNSEQNYNRNIIGTTYLIDREEGRRKEHIAVLVRGCVGGLHGGAMMIVGRHCAAPRTKTTTTMAKTTVKKTTTTTGYLINNPREQFIKNVLTKPCATLTLYQ